MVMVKILGDGEDPPSKFQHWIPLRIHLFVVLKSHFDSGIEQENSQYVDDPMKSVDQRHACENENCPEDKSTQNPPEQNFMLISVWNSEVGENHQEHKQIIHAERFFNEVT